MFDDLMNLINTIVGIAALLFTIYSTSKDSKIAKSETIIIEPYIRVGILFSPSSIQNQNQTQIQKWIHTTVFYIFLLSFVCSVFFTPKIFLTEMPLTNVFLRIIFGFKNVFSVLLIIAIPISVFLLIRYIRFKRIYHRLFNLVIFSCMSFICCTLLFLSFHFPIPNFSTMNSSLTDCFNFALLYVQPLLIFFYACHILDIVFLGENYSSLLKIKFTQIVHKIIFCLLSILLLAYWVYYLCS